MAASPPGLRARILAPAAMVAVPMIALLLYLNLQQRDSEMRRVSQDTLRLAQLSAANQERLIEGAFHLLIATAQRYDLVTDVDRCNADLAWLLASYAGRYTNLGFADRAGDVRCSGIPGAPTNIADRSYFINATRTRGFAVSEYVVGRRTALPSIIFGYPLIGSQGEVRGVAYAAMNLNDLNRSFTQGDWADATLTVTDRNNVIVARVPEGDAWLGRLLTRDRVSDLLESSPEGVIVQEEEGEAHIVGFAAVAPASSGLVVRVSVVRSQAVLAANRAMYQSLAAFAIIALVVVGVVVAVSNRLVLAPINALMKACRRLEAGDLSTRAAASMAIPELSELGEAFDHMATSLEERQIAGQQAERDRQVLEGQIRQAQKLEAIGLLAGGVAHDFNNLLTIILGHAEVLAVELADGAHQTDVREIRLAAGRAAALTRQLLAFGRRQILSPQAVDLRESLTGTVAMVQRLIGENIEVRLDQAEDLGHVCADSGQMEQVILNLAINARDAMPDGGKLTIATREATVAAPSSPEHPGAAPGRYVVLAVSDTGVGMDAATQAHIFEPFFTTKDVGKGTGLGLSTVYGIVRQGGGFIDVRSVSGQGSTFTIYLPRVERPDVPLTAGAEPASALADRGATILVVEDERGLRLLVERVLSAHGHRVVSAATPQEALCIAAERGVRFDLVISDIVLPQMSGRALVDQLRVSQPLARVLYMSGYTDDVVVRHGVHTGQTPFLQKPFSQATLRDKVRDVLQQGRPI